MTVQNAVMAHTPDVEMFFHIQSSTFSYVVTDPNTQQCVVIDPCLDIEEAAGSIRTNSVRQIRNYIRDHNLSCAFILETHAHADHLSAAHYLKNELGSTTVIGHDITEIQRVFADIYSEPETFAVNGTQFDVLLGDGEILEFGSISITAMHVPGHTPACMAYLIGDALFVGDTLFMPDSGTARCDFPGGDARTLYQSIQRLFELPDETRVFVCHDYQPNGRELAFETTIGEQKTQNIHVRESISEAEFVSLRENRDAQLSMPKLILPSLQVNIRAGALPVHPVTRKPFITMPLNAFGGDDLKNIVENQ